TPILDLRRTRSWPGRPQPIPMLKWKSLSPRPIRGTSPGSSARKPGTSSLHQRSTGSRISWQQSQGPLHTAEQMFLKPPRAPDFFVVSQGGVERPALAELLTPSDGVILVVAAALGHIDGGGVHAQNHVQPLAAIRLLRTGNARIDRGWSELVNLVEDFR